MLLPLLLSLVALQDWDVDDPPGETRTWEATFTEGTWLSVDVSPDGEWLLMDLLGHIYELPATGGEARVLTRGRSWNMLPRYSPDGATIAFTSDRGGSNDLWIMDRDGRWPENVSAEDLPVAQGTWSADGSALYGTLLDMQVRSEAARYGLHGDKQIMLPATSRSPINHLLENWNDGLLYYVHDDRALPGSGPRVKTYDLDSGAGAVLIDRPGGADAIRLSPDGRRLAYVHRDDQDTVLVVRDLDSGEDRTLRRGLDRGRFDSNPMHGAYPNIAWHPDGTRIAIHFGGGLWWVDAVTGVATAIPFEAHVERELAPTQRVAHEVPVEGTVRTRSHRFGLPTPQGVVYEALGDLWVVGEDSEHRQLTDTPEHETSPVWWPAAGALVAASWSDDELGGLAFGGVAPDGTTRWGPLPLVDEEGAPLALRSQVGALCVDRSDPSWLAFVVGDGAIRRGTHVENQTGFRIWLARWDGERAVARELRDLAWSSNRYAHRPPTVLPDVQAGVVYFTEFVGDDLLLQRCDLDGDELTVLYRFPHATRAVLSPDLKWIAYREYHRSWLTPFAFVGQEVYVSAADGRSISYRVDEDDGDFMVFADGGATLCWTRGRHLHAKPIEEIVAGRAFQRLTGLSQRVPLDAPSGGLALRGVTVLTMDDADTVLEDATVLLDGPRIVAVGADVTVPEDCRVHDLPGRVVMPGLLDAHGHYGSPISALQVIEQRHYGLLANLAHGVTTMVDVYGTTQKDFWLDDQVRTGGMDGPRLLSVGDPIFVTRYRTKMHRPITSLGDAREHARFNAAHGATLLKDYSNHTRAARQQLIQACREQGLNLVAESFADPPMNMTQLIDGFTGLEHTLGLEDLYADVVGLFAQTEAGMTPTLVVVYNGPAGDQYFHMRERVWEDEKLLRWFNRDELLRYRRPRHHFDDDWSIPRMGRALRKLYDAGVPLTVGAHGQMQGLGAHWELELFVLAGFSPMEALRIGTRHGYEHHGLDAQLGSVEPGKLADLVVLSADPREDIRNSRAVELVLRHGILYDGRDGARLHPDPRPARPMYFQRPDAGAR